MAALSSAARHHSLVWDGFWAVPISFCSPGPAPFKEITKDTKP
jgi:hypothetical protein